MDCPTIQGMPEQLKVLRMCSTTLNPKPDPSRLVLLQVFEIDPYRVNCLNYETKNRQIPKWNEHRLTWEQGRTQAHGRLGHGPGHRPKKNFRRSTAWTRSRETEAREAPVEQSAAGRRQAVERPRGRARPRPRPQPQSAAEPRPGRRASRGRAPSGRPPRARAKAPLAQTARRPAPAASGQRRSGQRPAPQPASPAAGGPRSQPSPPRAPGDWVWARPRDSAAQSVACSINY
jgi:hypothetical protein